VSFNGPVYGELWVHELAHQWFGDMITCGSWNDLWLNEGWATFVTVEWLEQYSRYEYFPIGLRNNTRSIRQGPVGAIGQPDTANVSNLFNSALRYRKPAYMLLMLREWIGETAFRAGIRAYANDTALRWNYARTPQFIGHLAAACPSCGVEHFLNTWLYSQGLPRYEVQWGLAETEGAFIRLRQTNTVEGQPVLPQVMEVAVWAHDASGQPVHDTLAVPVNTPETTVHLPPGWTPDSLLLNPERYALVDTIVYSMRSTPNQIRLWPNPASEYLTIWVPALANQPDAVAEATVWDAAGRLVARLPAQNAGPAPRFEVRLLAPGSYLLRIGEEDAMRFVRP
jgi:aminopeptidase N